MCSFIDYLFKRCIFFVGISIPIIFKSDAYAMLCKKYSEERRVSDIVTLWRELQEKYNLSLDIFTAQMILRKMVKLNDVHNIEMIGKFLSSVSIGIIM